MAHQAGADGHGTIEKQAAAVRPLTGCMRVIVDIILNSVSASVPV